MPTAYTPRIQAALARQVRAEEVKQENIASRMEVEAMTEGDKVMIATNKRRAVQVQIRSSQLGIQIEETKYRIEGQKLRATQHQLQGAKHATGQASDQAREAGASRQIGQVAIVERLKASAIEVASLKSANEARLQDLKRISGRVPQLPRF